ncbi:MAG: hypothetical protein ACKOX6_11340 [Bdellovibrio sp.]
MKDKVDRVFVGIFFGLFILAALVWITGCATKPPDFPICVEMSMERGECIKVISGERIHVDNDHKMNDKTWWESRPTNMIMPLESWMDLKKFIIKMCKKNKGMCDKEVSSWQRSLQKIDQNLNEKGVDVPVYEPEPEPENNQGPDNYVNP